MQVRVQVEVPGVRYQVQVQVQVQVAGGRCMWQVRGERWQVEVLCEEVIGGTALYQVLRCR